MGFADYADAQSAATCMSCLNHLVLESTCPPLKVAVDEKTQSRLTLACPSLPESHTAAVAQKIQAILTEYADAQVKRKERLASMPMCKNALENASDEETARFLQQQMDAFKAKVEVYGRTGGQTIKPSSSHHSNSHVHVEQTTDRKRPYSSVSVSVSDASAENGTPSNPTSSLSSTTTTTTTAAGNSVSAAAGDGLEETGAEEKSVKIALPIALDAAGSKRRRIHETHDHGDGNNVSVVDWNVPWDVVDAHAAEIKDSVLRPYVEQFVLAVFGAPDPSFVQFVLTQVVVEHVGVKELESNVEGMLAKESAAFAEGLFKRLYRALLKKLDAQ
jgi:hypothetical protein